MAKFDEEPTAHREQCRKWGVKKRHMKIYPHYAIVYCVIAVMLFMLNHNTLVPLCSYL